MIRVGMLIGPMGLRSRHGSTNGGKLISTDGITTSGSTSKGMSGHSGIGTRKSVMTGTSAGSVGFSRSDGVCTTVHLALLTVTTGSTGVFGA